MSPSFTLRRGVDPMTLSTGEALTENSCVDGWVFMWWRSCASQVLSRWEQKKSKPAASIKKKTLLPWEIGLFHLNLRPNVCQLLLFSGSSHAVEQVECFSMCLRLLSLSRAFTRHASINNCGKPCFLARVTYSAHCSALTPTFNVACGSKLLA